MAFPLHDCFLGCMLVAWVTVVGGESEPRGFCNRNPFDVNAEKTPGDNGFRIKIAGRPEWYTPGQVYTISISGTYPKQKFQTFYLVAVPQNAEDESTGLGTFQHLNLTQTKFSDDCFYVVTSANQLPKSDVEVLWTAPGSGTGCLEFRATVVDIQHLWYKDDGALSRTFCEETGTTDGVQSVEMLPECCACGTAKYQMMFHGLWSERTHPKDFPKDHQLLHWSNIVGASHSKHYTIWQFGLLASKAVDEICQLGQPQSLEEEMRKHSQDIRTIIKTPKIQWSDPHGLEQLRWAHFSVDRKNHLLSMLTRLGPSPDWCVGVGALNLCLSNCSWSGDVTLELFPWDAGTDDGPSYMSPKRKSRPPSKIQRITNTDPADLSSPFSGPETVKPVALLKLRRIYPKPEENLICSDSGLFTGQYDTESRVESSSIQSFVFDDDQLTTGGICTTDWSSWSDCSVSCGFGVRERTRTAILNPSLSPSSSSCSEALTSSEHCFVNCGTRVDSCAVTQWSDWSSCDAHCNDSLTGTRKRFRSFVDGSKQETKRCEQAMAEEERCPPPMLSDCPALSHSSVVPSASNQTLLHATFIKLFQVTSSAAPSPSAPAPSFSSSFSSFSSSALPSPLSRACSGSSCTRQSNHHLFQCLVSEWSQWTSCSSSCGSNAFRVRTRQVRKLLAVNGTMSPANTYSVSRRCMKKRRQTKMCSLPKCLLSPVGCRLNAWTEWSPCAKTCGDDSIQERARHVVHHLPQSSRKGGEEDLQEDEEDSRCSMQLIRRLCALPPCLRTVLQKETPRL